MNAVAFSSYVVIFSAFKSISFMTYTYTELDFAPMMWRVASVSQGLWNTLYSSCISK